MSALTGLKAIETTYKGYRFRSRLEARWAVFFDALGVRYQYEPEGFQLGSAGWYLPDFWLPSLDCWVEIKPTSSDDQTIRKAHALSVQSEKDVIVFDRSDFDIPTLKPSLKTPGVQAEVRGMFGRVFPGGGMPGMERGRFGATWVTCESCSQSCVWIDWTCSFHRHFTDVHKVIWRDLAFPLGCQHADALRLAYLAARGARFEHGEHGR